MQIELGERLRELRRRDGRTQEDLAKALDVTSQAVSRWEKGICYPDMALIPPIANYFGISIDELFGYKNDRDRKVDAIIERIDEFHLEVRGDGAWLDECLDILRLGLAEFPQNEKLRITLADTLSTAGWRRHREWLYYDEEGYIQYNYDRHKQNKYWTEAVEICESLVSTASDNTIVTRAITILVQLYRNFGETEKAIAYAKRMPELKSCREIMLATATDGKDEAKYIGDFLLKSAREFSDQLVYGLITDLRHYQSDLPIEKIKGCISLFHMICDDGNLGGYHDDVTKLYLYLSRIQWERGYHDDAFLSLDEALKHARRLEKQLDGEEHSLTAPLVSFVRCEVAPGAYTPEDLPESWPYWCNPDYGEVEKEIKADPRWDEWVEKCKEKP